MHLRDVKSSQDVLATERVPGGNLGLNWPPDLLSVRGQHATQMMRPRLTLFNGDKCQPPGVPTGCLIGSEMAMKMQFCKRHFLPSFWHLTRPCTVSRPSVYIWLDRVMRRLRLQSGHIQLHVRFQELLRCRHGAFPSACLARKLDLEPCPIYERRSSFRVSGLA